MADTSLVSRVYQNICGTKFSRYLFSARSEFGIFIVFFNEVFSSYVIRVNCVSYMLLSVSMFFLRVCNATRYNTVLLFLCYGLYFHVFLYVFPFFQCGDFGHLSSTCLKPADSSKSSSRRD